MLFKSKKINSIECCAVSNVGKKRTNNEDNFAINGLYMSNDTVKLSAQGASICVPGKTISSSDIPVFAVCDGMGGEALGEVASNIAAEQFSKLFGKSKEDMSKLADKAVERANAMIVQRAEQTCHLRIGTTFVLAYIVDGIMYVENVGDSRLYLLRGRKMKQISYDHTELQYYVDAKMLTKEKARTHPGRHSLTQHLGMDGEALKPYKAKPIKVESGDKILLCSDGITEMLTDSEILSIMHSCETPEDAAKNLVDAALANGGVDNSTALTVFIR